MIINTMQQVYNKFIRIIYAEASVMAQLENPPPVSTGTLGYSISHPAHCLWAEKGAENDPKPWEPAPWLQRVPAFQVL